MIVVLDASAALEMALARTEGPRFRAMLAGAELVLAPDIYPSEVTNAFWKYHAFESLSVETCMAGIEYCTGLVDDCRDTRDPGREAFAEAVRLRHPVYDLYYLVLARRNGACLLTRDKTMMKLARDLGVEIAGA